MRRSRRTLATIAIFLLTAVSQPAIAAGYLPSPCEGLPNIDFIRCPTPYIELIPDRHDDIFARNFLCRETSYYLGAVRGGGCGSSGMAGWSLPPGVSAMPANSVDYRAEIMEHVVDPCYLDMALRNPVEGVTPEKMMELAKMVADKSVNEMVENLMPIAAKIHDLEKRQAFYAVAKELCISAARGS